MIGQVQLIELQLEFRFWGDLRKIQILFMASVGVEMASAPSVMGGKILAGLALGQKNRWGEHPLIDRHTKMGRFPPKPIRFIGAHIVRSAVALKERAEIEDKTPNFLSVQISKLAPSGLEDKE